jgi:hypothetical protein
MSGGAGIERQRLTYSSMSWPPPEHAPRMMSVPGPIECPNVVCRLWAGVWLFWLLGFATVAGIAYILNQVRYDA